MQASKRKIRNTAGCIYYGLQRMDHQAAVALLLEKDADLKSKDRNGQIPLSWSAASGHEAIVNFLLENYAHIESKDDYGGTTLSFLLTCPVFPIDWLSMAGDPSVSCGNSIISLVFGKVVTTGLLAEDPRS